MNLKDQYSAAAAIKQTDFGGVSKKSVGGASDTPPADSPNYMALHGLRLLSLGYAPIPIAPYSKKPSRHIGDGRWVGLDDWGKYAKAPPTTDEVSEWAKWPHCGVGIIAAGLSQLDIDVKDEDLVDELVEALEREAVAMPSFFRVGQAPKRLYIRQAPAPHGKVKIQNASTGDLVEVLGTGQQTVVLNLHPDTRSAYVWQGGSILDAPRDTLPVSGAVDLTKIIVVSGRLLHKVEMMTGDGVARVDEMILNSLSNLINNSNGNVDPQDVRETVASYGVKADHSWLGTTKSSFEVEHGKQRAEARAKFGPNSEARVRDVMSFLSDANAAGKIVGWDVYKLHVGYGLMDACRDLGTKGIEIAWELFSDFASRGSKYDAAQTLKDFRSFLTSRVTKVTERSLFWQAKQLGWSDDGKLSAAPPPDLVIDSEKPSTLPATRLSSRMRHLLGAILGRAVSVAHRRRELDRLIQQATSSITEEQVAERAAKLRWRQGSAADVETCRDQAHLDLMNDAQKATKTRFMRLHGKRALDPVRRLVRGSAGGGKSTISAELLAEHWGLLSNLNIEYAVMSHAEAEKIEADIRAAFALVNAGRGEGERHTPFIKVIYGRTSETRGKCHPDRRPLVKQAEGKVSSVFGTFCKGKDILGEVVTCPFFGECEHVAQFEYKGPGIRIVVHNYLFAESPEELRRPEPDIVFIDERFKAAALERLTVTVGNRAMVTGEGKPAEGKRVEDDGTGDFDRQAHWHMKGSAYDADALAIAETLAVKLRGLPDGALPMAVAKEIGYGALQRLSGAAQLAARSHDASQFLNPAWDVGRIADKVAQMSRNKPRTLQRVLERMMDDLNHLKASATSNSLWIRGGNLALVNTKSIRLPKNSSVIYLDADGRHETAQRLLGDELKTIKLTAERQGTIIQTYTDTGTKAYLTRKAGDLGDSRGRYSHLKDEELVATKFYDGLADHVRRDVLAGKRVMVASAKKVRDVMLNYAEAHGAKSDRSRDEGFNPNVSVDWFGARLTYAPVYIGSNDFKDFDVAHIVGREQPPVIEIEMGVGGLYFDDPTLKLTGKLEKRWRRIWVETGEVIYGEVDVHEDPRVQAELESIREDAIKQAIDRLRLLFDNPDREHPPVVYIHTNIPLPGLSVTELIHRDEMRDGGSKWTQALDVNDGLIILEGGWLERNSGWDVAARSARRNLLDLNTPGALPGDAVRLTLKVKDGDGRRRDLPVMVGMRVMVESPGDIPALAEDALSRDGVRAATVDWSSSLGKDDGLYSLDGSRAEPDPDGVEALVEPACGHAVVAGAGGAGDAPSAVGGLAMAAGGLRLVELEEGSLVWRMAAAQCILDLTLPGAATIVAAALGVDRSEADAAVRRAKGKRGIGAVNALGRLVGKPTHRVSVRGGHTIPIRASGAVQLKLVAAGLTAPKA